MASEIPVEAQAVIPENIEALTRAIAECGELVAVLCDRIAPVLTPTEKGYDTADGQRVTTSPLASQIYEQVDLVLDLSRHLTFTIERLEV